MCEEADMDLRTAAIAAQRFGFGARPGELKQIAGDPRGWVKSQLEPERQPPAVIAALPSGQDDLRAFGRWLLERRIASGRDDAIERRAAREGFSMADLKSMSVEQSFASTLRARRLAAVDARLRAAATTDRAVYERLVHFWSNHFTVSAAKPAAVALPPSFEREAIRPHAAGSFRTMLRASTKHPAMLVYLDNWLSVGPNSRRGKRPAPPAGAPTGGPRGARDLNENLAREVLELHTLGVDGGYTQADVRALAETITGWTYRRPGLRELAADGPGPTGPAAALFEFDDETHEPGAKTLLGRTYPQSGVAQGEAALDDLARDPSTASFVARKLVRHYVADDPPPDLVARCARTFATSDGDIAATMRTLIDAPEAWSPQRAKFKRPEEFLVSILRALGAPPAAQSALPAAVLGMGQAVYTAPGPNGWADTSDAWLSSDLVWKRIEYANLLAERAARGDIDPVALGEATLGPLLTPETRDAVKRAQSPAQALALLFSSPEFQFR
jgi:uncharacterized protein (DUF1800 family)